MHAPSRRAIASAAVACAGGVSRCARADPTAPELAEALQQKYDGDQGLLRRLRRTPIEAASCSKQITERGRLLVKKPGKMRWDYTAPEKKLFVSDGVEDVLVHPAGQAGHRQRGAAATTRRRRRRCSWPARAT